jgi:exopolysaccharide biosynthesis polyprenyl glycosylphosphotransferase
MALPYSVQTKVQWRTATAPPRVPLAAAAPSTDALALFGALAISGQLTLLGFAYAFAAFLAMMCVGTQRGRINPRMADDAAALIGSLSAAVVIVAPLAVSDAQLGALLRIAPAAILLVLLGRLAAYRLVREVRARGFVLEPTLIVGAGAVGVEVARTLQDHPEFGLVPIGFLDSFDDADLPLPILGGVRELEPVVSEFAVKRVIVAFGGTREPEMVRIIRECDHLPVELHVMPRFFELGVAAEGGMVDDLWGIPLVRLRRSALRTAAWRTKRVFDIVVSSLALVAAAPVLLLATLAVRLTSRGPILFRQKRIGQRGQVIEVLKFRTMRQNEDSDSTWSVADDERRTVAGRFLRKTSIDELPQLFNVIRGDMSMIGPRPERPLFAVQFAAEVPRYEDRHRVPVGITGWAQVHGLRGDTSIPERARFDNYYVEHWSLWRDVVILFRTVGAVLGGSGD